MPSVYPAWGVGALTCVLLAGPASKWLDRHFQCELGSLIRDRGCWLAVSPKYSVVPVYEYINSKHESGAWSGSYNQNDHEEQVCESENWQCNDFY